MKKSNRQRDMLLQKKRTKRNQSRKGKTYNPHKFREPVANLKDQDVVAL